MAWSGWWIVQILEGWMIANWSSIIFWRKRSLPALSFFVFMLCLKTMSFICFSINVICFSCLVLALVLLFFPHSFVHLFFLCLFICSFLVNPLICMFICQRLSGASLLIFANKQDIKGALTPEEIAKVRFLTDHMFVCEQHCFLFIFKDIWCPIPPCIFAFLSAERSQMSSKSCVSYWTIEMNYLVSKFITL